MPSTGSRQRHRSFNLCTKLLTKATVLAAGDVFSPGGYLVATAGGRSTRASNNGDGTISFGNRSSISSGRQLAGYAGADLLDVGSTALTAATAGGGGVASKSLPMGAGYLLEQGTGKVIQNEGVQVGKRLLQETKKDDFNQARNKAMSWLEGEGFKAERPNIGKLGATEGKTTGMVGKNGTGGTAGFRVEHDARSGAHINVFSGKSKGPINPENGKPIHFEFDASAKTVDKIQRKYGR